MINFDCSDPGRLHKQTDIWVGPWYWILTSRDCRKDQLRQVKQDKQKHGNLKGSALSRQWKHNSWLGLEDIFQGLWMTRGRGGSGIFKVKLGLWSSFIWLSTRFDILFFFFKLLPAFKNQEISYTHRYFGGGLVIKSCPTLGIPWTVACQAPLSMGFSRLEYWSGLPFPSSGDLPDPGMEPESPALQADSLPTDWAMREASLKKTI